MPDIAVEVTKEEIVVKMSNMDDLHLEKRPDFDFEFPLHSAPDVLALNNSAGICVSIHFKSSHDRSFDVYLLGKDAWIYQPKETEMWLHWRTGERSATMPAPIKKIWDVEEQNAGPSIDPFAKG